MRTFSRIFICLLAAVLCVPAGAKSKTLSGFISKVAESCVSFDYSYSAQVQKSKMKGSGSIKVQGNSFFMEGNGIEVWCDGKTRWTIDRAAEEAVIENVEDSADEYAANPALLVTSIDDSFSEVSFGPSQFGGKAVDSSVLNPLNKAENQMDIAQLRLYFKSGTSVLAGAQVKFKDGTVTVFTVSSLKYTAPENEKESFRFNEKTLDSSYVITDLR